MNILLIALAVALLGHIPACLAIFLWKRPYDGLRLVGHAAAMAFPMVLVVAGARMFKDPLAFHGMFMGLLLCAPMMLIVARHTRDALSMEQA